MYNKLNNAMITALMVARKLERGDTDSSGSTLRTLGVVILVVAVVTVIGLAVIAAANLVATNISSTTFVFK